MSETKKIITVADRSTKALSTAASALAKVVTELQEQTALVESLSDTIQTKEAELANLQSSFDLKYAENSQALRIRVLENEDQVLQDLLNQRKQVGVAQEFLASQAKRITELESEMANAVSKAIATTTANLKAAHAAEMNAREAEHKVSAAQAVADLSAKDSRIEHLSTQIAYLQKQIDDERNTRLQIAQAESNKQGVTVNTGK